MRVILAGQRSFGRAALEAIDEAGHTVAGVVSPAPDDPDGPYDKLTAKALQRGDVWSGRMDHEWVAERDADLIVCAHSHAFIGRKSRRATSLGALGYHPSLLPRHRGRDAVEWTVRMGDPVAGGTVYWFTDTLDGGPVAAQDWVFVERGTTASELWRGQLFPLGLELLLRVLKDLDNRVLIQIPQDERFATWEPSLDTPRLYRPELPELGSGPAGYTVVANRR